MKTLTEPITSVRIYESRTIKTVESEIRVKGTALNDDKTDVRLSAAGPYRIVMHCHSTGRKRTDNRAISNS